jgi:hypothetical protein
MEKSTQGFQDGGGIERAKVLAANRRKVNGGDNSGETA